MTKRQFSLRKREEKGENHSRTPEVLELSFAA